jgi:hypothetical protein
MKYTKEKLQQILNTLGGEQVDSDDVAYDIADGVLYDNPGLKEYIAKTKNVKDPLGWLANRI